MTVGRWKAAESVCGSGPHTSSDCHIIGLRDLLLTTAGERPAKVNMRP